MLQFSCCNHIDFQVNIQHATAIFIKFICCNCIGFQVNTQLAHVA